MKKVPTKTTVSASSVVKHGRYRAEKISAVEGLFLSKRMRTVLDSTSGKSGDERRAAIRAQFTKQKSA